MRFNFDLQDPNLTQRRSVTPKDEVEWVPLQNHPIFCSTTTTTTTEDHVSTSATSSPRNLMAWDGATRLYFWDSNKHCLHRISIRLGEPQPTSFLASSPSKVLQADVQLNFVVHKISINRNRSAILLAGSDGLCVMYLYGRNSTKENAIICRTVTVGSQIYSNGSNAIRMLQVSWHPYSDTHMGILSSDSVFRLFDLSSDLLLPEQEYYLQPVEPGRSRNVTSICPVDFSFGGDHLWDRFSVFVLYTDGSLYILCPVVPFGSFYKWEYILEIYSDAHTFGLKSANSTAVSNSNLAISWLEATFPELANQEAEGGDMSMLRAHPYALYDASISLQGPLRKVCHGGDENFAVQGAECKGLAVSFLYNLVSNDSILVTAWSGGQLQIDALADEIQPVWNLDSPPRLRVDPNDQVLGLAMICESIEGELPIVKLDQPLDHTFWLGHPPPLLRLAIVDLALPRETDSGSLIMLFADPLMPERLFSLHDGGIDSIVLHFLPFTNQTRGKDETMRTPSVHPILSTCQGENPVQSPLCGFVSLSDSFGYSWIVGVTVCQECVVLEIKTWNLLLPMHVDMDKSISLHEQKERDIPDIISKELLLGPKAILLPQAQPNLRSVAADSIEGRQTLHQYFKPFHENYVEYAHKTGMEKNLFGSHPDSLAATKSRGPPPAFASDPLIAVPSLGGMDNNASSPLVAQDEINVIAGYSAAAGAGSSKVPDILEVDGPSMAGNFMKGSSPQIKNPKIAILDSGIDHYFFLFVHNNGEEDSIVAKSSLFYENGDRERDEKDRTVFDILGHGTKLAAIAAGRKIEAKLYKTFPITIEGSASFADLYIYKIIWKEEGTYGSIINSNCILDAFEAAIEDEVDVICIAIGGAICPYHEDAISVGSFFAMKANILTVAACGNDGPSYGSVRNSAPWLLTVGASKSDKSFVTTVKIGHEEFKGSSLTLSETEWLPLIEFPSLNLETAGVSENRKKLEELEGKIVLCKDGDEVDLAIGSYAKGILYKTMDLEPYAKVNDQLSVWFKKEEFKKIQDSFAKMRDGIIASGKDIPILSKICRSERINNSDMLIVPDLSGRGPNSIMDILKPDLCAPGVEIPVPCIRDNYTISTGTSFACPLVAGKAAIIKHEFEKKGIKLSPASIKSALMTTTVQELKNPQEVNGPFAVDRLRSAFARGAGFMDFIKAKDPGLVYDCGEDAFASSLLGQGYDKEVRSVFQLKDKAWEIIKPWDLNSPSFMVVIPKGSTNYSLRVSRTLKNVDTSNCDYEGKIEEKALGVEIEIEPSKLHFEGLNSEQQFTLIFRIDTKLWKHRSSFVTYLAWTNEDHSVRSIIVIVKQESLDYLVDEDSD